MQSQGQAVLGWPSLDAIQVQRERESTVASYTPVVTAFQAIAGDITNDATSLQCNLPREKKKKKTFGLSFLTLKVNSSVLFPVVQYRYEGWYLLWSR